MSTAFVFLLALFYVVAASDLQVTQVSPGHYSSTRKTTTPSKPTSTSSTTPVTTSPTIPTTAPTPSNIYYVNDSSEVCILLQTSIKIIAWQQNNPNLTKEAVAKVYKTEGKCGNQEEHISLNFFNDWILTFTFSELKENNYFMSDVSLDFDLGYFSGFKGKGKVSKANLTQYGNHDGLGYRCDEGLRLEGNTLGQWNYTVTAEIRDFRVEAFRHNATTTEFNSNGEKNCLDSNNLIPIIVGSVLIALILIVLIAYLISRRKRRAGYESV